MEKLKELSVEELANQFENIDVEKFVKALILFEKKKLMEGLNPSQIQGVLNETYEFYMDSPYSSFLQEEIGEKLEKIIDRELSINKSKKDISLER